MKVPMSDMDLADRVLYRDREIIIIDKPHGIAVHASGPKGGHYLRYDSLKFDSRNVPELGHRLDRDTSGCLVLGRNRQALAKLGEIFANHQADKTYWAVVIGCPKEESGIINQPLKKLEKRFGWRMVADPKGQSAITHYRVMGKTDRFSWLELKPQTGRTHQLRVHLANLGCPILGDSVYGRGTADLIASELHLHARSIVLNWAPGKSIKGQAKPPAHMLERLGACGYTQPQPTLGG